MQKPLLPMGRKHPVGVFWIETSQRNDLRPMSFIAASFIASPQSSSAWLSRLPASTRKLLIHINNTNPILDELSPERAACTAAGVEVCHDGLEINL